MRFITITISKVSRIGFHLENPTRQNNRDRVTMNAELMILP